ncbi:hypothetical protein [Streptomyces canus]|uniref:hypothetical protein n=1 Tax=Streptomyces canus TaxID=58343 RepID=UPI002E32EAD6|nr:hypothetical protein [Streptomyces canus]
MTQATEVPMDIPKDFDGTDFMQFSLRDDETFGSDSLGVVNISHFESNGEHSQDFSGGSGGSYTLTYRVREIID